MINVKLLLDNAHRVLLDTVDGLSTSDWDFSPRDGAWSSRDILAYLTALELLLIELNQSTDQQKPLLDIFCSDRKAFVSHALIRPNAHKLSDLFAEYEEAHEMLLASITQETLRRPVPHRRLRRYGPTVADCMIAIGYGQKLVRAAQICSVWHPHRAVV